MCQVGLLLDDISHLRRANREWLEGRGRGVKVPPYLRFEGQVSSCRAAAFGPRQALNIVMPECVLLFCNLDDLLLQADRIWLSQQYRFIIVFCDPIQSPVRP